MNLILCTLAVRLVMRVTLFVASLQFILGGLPVLGDTPLTKDEEQKYTTVASNIVHLEEAYLKENGCWMAAGIPSIFYFKKTFNVWGQQDVVVLESANPIFHIELLPNSAQVVSFANWTSRDVGNKYYPEPPKLKWTREKVASLAAGYAKAILGAQMPDNLGAPFVQTTPERDGLRYMDADWRVVWARVDKEGHRFHRDSLVVLLTDGHGPTNLGYNFWSHYDDKLITPIAQDKALALASEYAKQVLAWGPGAPWLQNFELINPPQMDLEVVTPNHLTTQPSIETLGHNSDLNARLAWVVYYKKKYKGTISPGGLIPIGGELQVWIDAENGQLLGGDFK